MSLARLARRSQALLPRQTSLEFSTEPRRPRTIVRDPKKTAERRQKRAEEASRVQPYEPAHQTSLSNVPPPPAGQQPPAPYNPFLRQNVPPPQQMDSPPTFGQTMMTGFLWGGSMTLAMIAVRLILGG